MELSGRTAFALPCREHFCADLRPCLRSPFSPSKCVHTVLSPPTPGGATSSLPCVRGGPTALPETSVPLVPARAVPDPAVPPASSCGQSAGNSIGPALHFPAPALTVCTLTDDASARRGAALHSGSSAFLAAAPRLSERLPKCLFNRNYL